MGAPVKGIDSRIGFVFQSDALFPWRTVIENVMAGPLFRGRAKAEATAAARDWLARVGLARFEHHYPHQLSGGMRQRAVIAMALSCNPALLVADEPTTALDVTVQAGILDLVRKLRSTHKSAVVFITHDMGVVSELADRVMVMYAGRIVERGSRTELFSDPRHPYTRALLGSIPPLTGAKPRRLPAIPGSPPSLLR
ncbi:MAG: ABC transporter ATP-binding protein, partial [Mesorhizobium sp.]